MSQGLLVLHFCPKDVELAILCLKVSQKLDGKSKHSILLSHDGTCNEDQIAEIRKQSEVSFREVLEFKYEPLSDTSVWPLAENRAWQQSARHIERSLTERFSHWFWWEADAIPLRPGWFDRISESYQKARKPFAGFVLNNHMNGVGLWPSRISSFLHESSSLYVRAVPFDKVAGKEVFKRGVLHLNGVLEHHQKDQGGGPGLSFDKMTWVRWRKSHSTAMFFHGCTDGSLHHLLIGDADSQATVLQQSIQSNEDRIDCTLPKPIWNGKSFYSSGDLGDIIYALAVIRALGGGRVFLGPTNKFNQKHREEMTRSRCHFIAPVLKHQSYIEDVRFSESDIPKGAIDLNGFRTHYNGRYKPWRSLIQTYSEWLDTPIPEGPWLSPSKWPFSPFIGKIIVQRSLRYRGGHFPWSSIVDHFAPNILFIGNDSEYDNFVSNFGLVERLKIRNLFEAYVWISNCEVFIGNQSCLRAISEGLGKPVLMEGFLGATDCDFERSDSCGIYFDSSNHKAESFLRRFDPSFTLLPQLSRIVC